MSPWESFFSSRSARRRSPIIIAGLFHRSVWKASNEPAAAKSDAQLDIYAICCRRRSTSADAADSKLSHASTSSSAKSSLGSPLRTIASILASSYGRRSEEHTSELQSPCNLVCRLLLEKKKTHYIIKSAPAIPVYVCLLSASTTLASQYISA